MDTHDTNNKVNEEEISLKLVMETIKRNIRTKNEMNIPTLIGNRVHDNIMGYESVNKNSTLKDLENANLNCNIQNTTYSINSHRPLVGKFLVKGREVVHGEARRYVDPIFIKQENFNRNVVQILNKNEKIDSLVITEIDHLKNFSNKLEKQIKDISDKTAEYKKEIEELNKIINKQNIEYKKDLENLLSQINISLSSMVEKRTENILLAFFKDIENERWLYKLQEKSNNMNTIPPKIEGANFEINYSKFNEMYGGSEKEIKDICSQFLNFFMGCKNVLDIGSGRGIFLELLKENGIKGYGIDVDDDLIEYCKRKGLDVKKDEAYSHLDGLGDNSVDGIFMAHVIEHLPKEETVHLMKLFSKKLKENSYAVIALPNILNISVSSNTFYLDPTHINHLHPEVLKFLLRENGFKDIQERFYQPFPAESKLNKIECLKGENVKDFEDINRNFDILNQVLFGYRDYAVIAKNNG
jgi:2-polyprenyl-3-methyl-5-hydroxy-6-metoxy-1,4-benzoquinol methylase